MFNTKNKNIFVLNFLIAIIPFSYISGNLVLNLNTFIIIFYGFSIYKFEIFRINFNLIDKLLILLFLYIGLNGIFNNFFNFDFPEAPEQNLVLTKSFLFLRYILLYFVIRFLVERKFIDYKIIFVAFSLSSIFVSIDVIIQFIFGKDIFGFEASGRRLPGPFGDELIAGSFIQRFFVFIPFSMIIFLKLKKQIVFQSSFFLVTGISIIGLILAGNRIPLILFLFLLFLIFFYIKNLRKILIASFIVSAIGLTALLNSNIENKSHYFGFVIKGNQIINYVKNRIISGEITVTNIYIKEIESGILTWRENKLFGGGIKSFRWHCNGIDRSKMLKFVTKKGQVNCNNHPHNYYLQIASELGAIGFLIITSILFIILYKSLKKLHFSHDNEYNKYLLPFFFIFILEFFPFKTTGSFFSTTNSNFIFLILPFVVGLLHKK